ncbi:MAG: hypothetical protein KJO08_10750, partial [Gammaproteobacteria bacterium]|nr:hypothetical protein [Gammaproteobacteria bacterium]
PILSERLLAQMCRNMSAVAIVPTSDLAADEGPLPGAGGAAVTPPPSQPEETGIEGVLKRRLNDL